MRHAMSQNSYRPSRLAYAIFIASFLTTSHGFSAITDTPIVTVTPPTINQANITHLARSQGWLRLLYYPADITPSDKHFRSRVKSPSFFVSQTGGSDPTAELEATITALFAQNMHNIAPQDSVQCRFPARTHWIKQQFGISDTQLPTIDCNQLHNWLFEINPSRASLIFAEEYLDNPASMFGHSFLRMDNDTTQQAHILNYLPKFAPNTSFVKTSYESLIAGTPGEFTVEPYEQKIRQYREDEGRDIWRYQLKLSPAELQQLARQIWEIKDQHLTYYLTTDNCASEILVLLNALRPDKNYLKDFHTIVSPADLVRALQQQDVLQNAIYEPSTKTKKQAILNQSQHTTASAALSKHQLTDPALLPNGLVPNDNNPQFAHGLGRFSFGIGQQTQQYKTDKQSPKSTQDFAELGYRLVYHDSLDPRSGYPAGFSLEALSLNVRVNQDPNKSALSNIFTNNKVELQNFTLIKARSLNPVNTADKGNSWGGQITLEQQSDGVKQHLVSNIGAEYGWSIAYGSPTLGSGQIPPNLCYALATGNIQAGKGLQQGYRVGVGANLGCIQQLNGRTRGIVELALPFWYQCGRQGDDSYWQPMSKVGMQYDFNPSNALRFTYQYQWQPNQALLIKTINHESKLNQTVVKPENLQNLSLQYLHYF